MKSYISAILIHNLLLQLFGCTSFRPLENGEDVNNYIKSSSRINFILNNNQAITVKASKCKIITQEDFILFGKGTLNNKISRESTPFSGEISKISVDSTKYISVDSNEYLVCWTNRMERISFEKGDYVFDSNLKPDSTYWLIKDYNSPQLIAVNEISKMEVEEINLLATIPLAIVSLAVIVGIIALAKNLPTGKVLP